MKNKKNMLPEYDKLKKFINTKEGKQLFETIRKQLKASEKYSNKLNIYLSDTLDGVKPEDSARQLKLI